METSGVVALVPVLPVPAAAPVACLELHGRPLYVHAAATVRTALGVPVLLSAPVALVPQVSAALREAGLGDLPVLAAGDLLGPALVQAAGAAATVLLHDPRCPLAPPALLRDLVEAAQRAPHAVVVAARPMTDTVKELVDGAVRSSVERDQLRAVASPLLVPAGLLRQLSGRLATCRDPDELLQLLRVAGADLLWSPAPGRARRVEDAAALRLLECLTDVG